MDFETATANHERAHKTLGDLREKQSALTARTAVIAERKKALAFDAHTKGGKAQTELAGFNREAQANALQADDLVAAISEAERHLAFADDVIIQLRTVAEAEATLAKVQELPPLFEKFDTAVRDVCDAANMIRARMGEVDPRHNWLLVMGALRRALQGALFGEGTQLQAEVYPPSQRRAATESLMPIKDRIERGLKTSIADANAKLAGKKKQAA